MLLIFFILGVLFGITMLVVGNYQSSWSLVYLGMFVFLVMGMFLMSEGISVQEGSTLIEVPAGSGNYTTEPIYVTHTTANNPIVSIIANTFFYIPFAGILLSLTYALANWTE